MKTDIYTKVVLTVIALCLIWLCKVQMNPSPIRIAKIDGMVYVGADIEGSVDIKGTTSVDIQNFTAIPIEIKSIDDTVNVNGEILNWPVIYDVKNR